jgi:hypothetical protein
MTCPRTAAHEETELLTVLKIPFRVRTPLGWLYDVDVIRHLNWSRIGCLMSAAGLTHGGVCSSEAPQ